jgi:hypothetical protein
MCSCIDNEFNKALLYPGKNTKSQNVNVLLTDTWKFEIGWQNAWC